MMANSYNKKFADLIKISDNIVFFGGAGVSTESNIPDFRSPAGLYSKRLSRYAPEEIIHSDFLKRKPEIFYEFYFNNMLYPNAVPNDAHKALAYLEKSGKRVTVVTQNIDGLHQMAESSDVIELHGSVHRNYCVGCKKNYSLEDIMGFSPFVPVCGICGGMIRPDVVLYGETLNQESLSAACRAAAACDLLIVGGTSLRVYPAAGILDYYNGDNIVIINNEETPYDDYASLIIREPIGKVFAEALEFVM